MARESSSAVDATNGEFVISRTFDAPRDLVWKAFTEPERMAQWWGPKGFTMRTMMLDLRTGGEFRYAMSSADGHEMCGKVVYGEIDPPRLLETIVSFTDENWQPIRHPMSPTWPLEVKGTMTLTESNGKTTLTLRSAPHKAGDIERKTFAESFDSMEEGFTGTFDQLDAYLATIQ